MRILGFITAMVASIVSASADVVTMTSGNQIECIVLQESTTAVSVRRGYGTMLLPKSAVASIKKSPVITDAVAPTSAPSAGQRIPGWTNVLAAITRQSWAFGLQQIPATVVDVGSMKHVPYQSYRCGTDYELNIYGDPDHPACVEIGLYRTLLNNSEAKQRCVDLISSILSDKTDAAIVKAMDKSQDLLMRKGLTVEITPPSSPDAYGGWWVSVYDEKLLDEARASEDELKQIAVANPSAPSKPLPVAASPSPAVRVASTPTPVITRSVDVDDTSWTMADLAKARAYINPAINGSSATGQVYVKGYYRKNGTYVRSYTRRK